MSVVVFRQSKVCEQSACGPSLILPFCTWLDEHSPGWRVCDYREVPERRRWYRDRRGRFASLKTERIVVIQVRDEKVATMAKLAWG